MGKPSSGQMKEFWSQVESGRITSANFQRFLDTPGWQQSQPDETYTVTVDHTLSLPEMVAAGKYDWVNKQIIPENFPVQGEGQAEVEVILVHLDRYATTEGVEAELDKRGLRPATIEVLLALGEKHPDLQWQFPVVALGSRCLLSDGEEVPVLCRSDRERELRLNDCHFKWGNSYRFAAVRK